MKSIEPHITDNYSTNQSRHDMRRSKDSSGARERNRFCGRCFPKITEFYKTRRLCILISYFILGKDIIFDPSLQNLAVISRFGDCDVDDILMLPTLNSWQFPHGHRISILVTSFRLHHPSPTSMSPLILHMNFNIQEKVTIIFGTCYGIIYWLYTTGPKQAKTCFVDPCGQFQPRVSL